jgi:hypothetical protein
MIEDFMGNQYDYKGVTTADIPSLLNKIQDHPINDDGGITYKQGIFADPEKVASAETLTADAILAGIDWKPWVVLGGGILLLLFIAKVAK